MTRMRKSSRGFMFGTAHRPMPIAVRIMVSADTKRQKPIRVRCGSYTKTVKGESEFVSSQRKTLERVVSREFFFSFQRPLDLATIFERLATIKKARVAFQRPRLVIRPLERVSSAVVSKTPLSKPNFTSSIALLYAKRRAYSPRRTRRRTRCLRR